MSFIDDDGSIIVPKSVRPIIEYSETVLGTRSGALKQFRAGKLHIRDYGSYYSIHSDKINPSNDPLGHLMVDAPEYLIGILSGAFTYSVVKRKIKMNAKMNNINRDSLNEAHNRDQLLPYIAGIVAAFTSHTFVNSVKSGSKAKLIFGKRRKFGFF